MQDFEKLGVFYLGKEGDPSTGKQLDQLLLYDSKDLTTHAVCVGMTGSGKTGLGITILEEAAIDKIPAIVIDPKGDLGNLLLAFPNLSPDEFLPWIDDAEAEREGMQPKEYAQEVAKKWTNGLAAWGEDAQRVKKFKNAVEAVIYTPASNAGIPLSILSSFAAPSKELMLDTGAIRERVLSVTSSLLGLLGIDADPIKSREHIFIATIIDQAWRQGVDLDIADLIQQVQKPSFDKIGAMDTNTFFPLKDRMALSISLNNLLASPGFQAWMEGEPLDIQQLLYTKDGKPKLSIITIAHLSDPERMFFVTLLLNAVISWMRLQPGTSSLRALLYMDEIFGYFPPTAMPPSKQPMLTLLKQARAYGVGIVLATQNPVDLDYKGLSNCGTWFIGKLQTERDKARVLEGLRVASNGEMLQDAFNQMMSLTGSRMFIMRSIHEKEPVLFQTRWTLCYLRGPLTLNQISLLTEKPALPAAPSKAEAVPVNDNVFKSSSKPLVPPDVPEYFLRQLNPPQQVHYLVRVMGMAKLHFVDAKNQIDLWKDVCIISSSDESGQSISWAEGKKYSDVQEFLAKEAVPGSTFDQLPAGLALKKNYLAFEKSLVATLYQNQTYAMYRVPGLKLTSKENESEADFRTRAAMAARESRDVKVGQLRQKYAEKMASLSEKVRRAQEKMTQKQQEAGLQKTETLLSVGTTVLDALLGRGVNKGTISKAGTSLKRAGRMSKDNRSAQQAAEDYQACQKQLQALQEQMKAEIANFSDLADPDSIEIETVNIRPRKSDITINSVALLWWPQSLG